jgi:hypothetical protein
MEKQNQKAQYESPKMHEHGDVRKITLGGGYANSDDGIGVNNAFPNPS